MRSKQYVVILLEKLDMEFKKFKLELNRNNPAAARESDDEIQYLINELYSKIEAEEER